MSEISNQNTTAQDEELDDFDVEGLGLKDVAVAAAGLTAAGTIAGGAGAAAMAVDNPVPGTTAGADAVVTAPSVTPTSG